MGNCLPRARRRIHNDLNGGTGRIFPRPSRPRSPRRFTVRHSVRFVALALVSAAAVSLAAQRASAGLLDGGWGGCGCGGYSYVQPYAAPLPYVVFETQTVIRPAYVVAPSYGYATEPMVGYGGWYHHPYYRHYGWRHHY
jgi:hypothetical protein